MSSRSSHLKANNYGTQKENRNGKRRRVRDIRETSRSEFVR